MYKIFFSGGIAIVFNSFFGDCMISFGIIGGTAASTLKFTNSFRTISAVVGIKTITANINAIEEHLLFY